MIIVHARARIKPESRDAFLRAVGTVVARTRTEKGCIDYGGYEDATVPNEFIFFECWESQAAIDTHFAMPHTTAFLQLARTVVTEPPSIMAYKVSAARKLA